MTIQASPFSRALALLGLLLVALTMIASGMSLEEGLWQKVPPLVVLAAGLVLVLQFLSIITSGASSVAANLLWRFAAAFGFFAAAFSLLILLIPDTMWEVTKQIGANTQPLPAGIPAGVDPRLKDVVDISGPFSPALIFVINIVLIAVSFLGSKVEDSNPDMQTIS